MFKEKSKLTWIVIVLSMIGAFLALYVAISNRLAGRGLNIVYLIIGVSLIVVSVAAFFRMRKN